MPTRPLTPSDYDKYQLVRLPGTVSLGHFEVESGGPVTLVTAYDSHGDLVTSAGAARLDQAWLRLIWSLRERAGAGSPSRDLADDATQAWWQSLSEDQREPYETHWKEGFDPLEHVSLWEVFGDGGYEPEEDVSKRERFRWALCDLVHDADLPDQTVLSELVGGVGAHACATGLVEDDDDADALGEVVAGAVRASLGTVQSIRDRYRSGLILVRGDFEA